MPDLTDKQLDTAVDAWMDAGNMDMQATTGRQRKRIRMRRAIEAATGPSGDPVTHHDGCWREHHSCAVALIGRMQRAGMTGAAEAIAWHPATEKPDSDTTGQTTAITRTWREVFGFPGDAKPGAEELERTYRTLRSASHPDRGGSADQFQAVQAAYEQAQFELGVGRV